ncbi:MAG TPA: Gfo/Idh/MocA family oxidoreductase [Candidatus Lumbricidophila sp.]|nr:Gfo/Idh/MocA family oxidoreductase [Candidatus Lumbricidophila sp.]
MSHPQLRVGIVGAGGITQAHVPGWQSIGAEVAVWSKGGADRLAAQYGLREAQSFEELVASVDLIDICTPTATHLDYANAALKAGVPVISEKPVSLDPDAARETGRLAAERGLGLYPAHVVRYFPEYVAAKRAIDAGDIGRPAVMRFQRIGECPAWAPWYGDLKQSGGIIVDQMIHDIDAARWFAGEVVEVYATRVADVERHIVTAQVVLTHESGTISYLNGVWGAKGLTFRTVFSVAGDAGLLTFDSRDAASVHLDTGSAATSESYLPDPGLGESPYTLELIDFLGAIRGEHDARVTWDDGIRAAEIALAANESVVAGAPVRLSPALRSTGVAR